VPNSRLQPAANCRSCDYKDRMRRRRRCCCGGAKGLADEVRSAITD
jgi:hypothetical protein